VACLMSGRGAGEWGLPTHPAAPFESRGAGREKRGKRSWPSATGQGVASAAEFGNSNRSRWRVLMLSVTGWAVEKFGEAGRDGHEGLRAVGPFSLAGDRQPHLLTRFDSGLGPTSGGCGTCRNVCDGP